VTTSEQIQELREEISWIQGTWEPITSLGVRLRLIKRLQDTIDDLRKETK